jgi:tRNA G18 (ribose-2'-O)-methylase SpoU
MQQTYSHKDVRDETRKQRYEARLNQAVHLPVQVACINFSCDGNVAYVARSLAVFTGNPVCHCIGKMPDRRELMKLSGGHAGLVKFIQYRDPIDFIDYCRKNGIYLVSAELTDDAVSLYDTTFPKDKTTIFVCGHETLGVPVDILKFSDLIVKIPQMGAGACCNTAQTAQTCLYEYCRGYNGLHLR